jgi:hypothetical protein
MLANRLLNATALDITRYGSYTFDDEGNNVLGDPETISIRCNIQPFREGDQSVLMPDGTLIKGGQIVRTTTLLRTIDSEGTIAADECVIDGYEYICFWMENWNRYLSQKHYKYIFIRKDRR